MQEQSKNKSRMFYNMEYSHLETPTLRTSKFQRRDILTFFLKLSLLDYKGCYFFLAINFCYLFSLVNILEYTLYNYNEYTWRFTKENHFLYIG